MPVAPSWCRAMPAQRPMPTPAELAHWFSGTRNPKVDADQQLAHLHRVTAARPSWSELCVMAFDHRSPVSTTLARAMRRPLSRAYPCLKKLLVRKQPSTGGAQPLLARPYGRADRRRRLRCVTPWPAPPGAAGGWGDRWSCPVRAPCVLTARAPSARALTHWPTEQVVKCLLHYHPDDAYGLRLEQEEQTVLELWQAVRANQVNELLLEIILPKGHDDSRRRKTLRCCARSSAFTTSV